MKSSPDLEAILLKTVTLKSSPIYHVLGKLPSSVLTHEFS